MSDGSKLRRSGAGSLRRWWPVLAWMGLLFFLSSQPKLPGIPGLDSIDWSDKIKHCAFYGVLGLFIWRALGDKGSKWRRFVLTVGLSALYGLTDELHQRFVPNRSCDICDLAADTLGALCAASILWRGGIKLGRRKARRKDLRS